MALRAEFLAGIAERLLDGGNEGVACVWHAVHPRTMLAVISTPHRRRRERRRFLRGDDKGGGVMIELNLTPDGVGLGYRSTPVAVPVVVPQLALLTAVMKRPPRVHINSCEGDKLGDFLLSAQMLSHGTPIMNIITFITTKLDVVLKHCERGTGRILDPIRSVEHVQMIGNGCDNGNMNGISNFEGLKRFKAMNCVFVAPLPLRGMKNLSDIDLFNTPITDSDVIILAELLQLRSLTMFSCHNFTSLSPFRNHPSLQYLSAPNCNNLRSVSSLTSISTLNHVDLSHTAVESDEILECIEGFQAVSWLSVTDFYLSREPKLSGNWDDLRHLFLVGVNGSYFYFIATARHLVYLCMNYSSITEEQLSFICQSLLCLRELELVYCSDLRTTLSFLLPMTSMRKVLISYDSLTDDTVIPVLRERGVRCLID